MITAYCLPCQWRPVLSLHRHQLLSRPTRKLISLGPFLGRDRIIDTRSGYGYRFVFPTPWTLTATIWGLPEHLMHWSGIPYNITGDLGAHFQQRRCGCGLRTGRSTCHITFYSIWKLPAWMSIGIVCCCKHSWIGSLRDIFWNDEVLSSKTLTMHSIHFFPPTEKIY